MKNRIIALVVGIVLLLFALSIHAQITFEKWYGGINDDYGGASAAQTSDGGYIIAGTTGSFGVNMFDVYLIRTDSIGDTIWTKTYGGPGSDYGYSMVQTQDGGFIITGTTNSFSSGDDDIYLIRVDSFGDTLWTKTYGDTFNDEGTSISRTSDGGFVIAGGTSYYMGNAEIYLLKIDSLGNVLWTKKYGKNDINWAYCVEVSPNGENIVVGVTSSFSPGTGNIYLLKTDSLGDTMWTKEYGGNYSEVGYCVTQTTDSGYIVVGITNSYGAGIDDVYVIKTDVQGDTLWTKTFGDTSYNRAYSVVQTSDNGYAIAGYTKAIGVGNTDAYLIRIDSLGDTLFTKTYGGINGESAFSVSITSDGGFILEGHTSSYGAGGADIYFVKTDSLGDITGIQDQQDQSPTTKNLKSTVFPNPFTSMTNIKLQGASENNEYNLNIFDASGRLVKSIKLTTSTYQLGADLVPGVYFLKLTIGEHKETQKLIKIR